MHESVLEGHGFVELFINSWNFGVEFEGLIRLDLDVAVICLSQAFCRRLYFKRFLLQLLWRSLNSKIMNFIECQESGPGFIVLDLASQG